MKRPWLSSTSRRSGEGWRVTYYDSEHEPIVSVWHENASLAHRQASKHLEQLAQEDRQ